MRGKAAFITGAGSGIGRAIPQRFAEEGATIVAADLVAERAAEVKTPMIASDEARWVTGTALVVDGGLTSGVAP